MPRGAHTSRTLSVGRNVATAVILAVVSLSLVAPAAPARADVAAPNLVQSATMGPFVGGVSGTPVVDAVTHVLFEAVYAPGGTGASVIAEVNDLTGEPIRQLTPARDIFVGTAALAVDEATTPCT